jgi:hypothetical protein
MTKGLFIKSRWVLQILLNVKERTAYVDISWARVDA